MGGFPLFHLYIMLNPSGMAFMAIEYVLPLKKE